MMNQTFLLGKAHEVSAIANDSWSYDHHLEVNTMLVSGEATPVCTVSTMVTASKTEAAPGDDDPDPDAEYMY